MEYSGTAHGQPNGRLMSYSSKYVEEMIISIALRPSNPPILRSDKSETFVDSE
jgi:hypothetical protein